MKKLCVLALCFMLTSCYYSFKTGCFYAFQHVQCNFKSKKNVFDSYQKTGVSDEQKLEDMKICLGKYGDNIDYKKNIFYDLYSRYPRENVVHEFNHCMERKGYIFNM